MDKERIMLNNTEYNNVRICVLPVGVEAPDYSKGYNLPKSHRKYAPKCRESYEEEVEDEEVVDFDESEVVEEEVLELKEVEEVTDKVTVTLVCFNGMLTLSGNFMSITEVMSWFRELGAKSSKDITLSDDGIFNIHGDSNDGSYRYFRGDFMHKDPARCFGLVEVEPIEDGGRVWRDFTDFDVKATFNLV